MFQRLTDRAARFARSRHMLWSIFVLSFGESTVIPIPIEVILVPLMAANPARIWAIATSAFLGCVAGALAGYAVGLLLFGTVGHWLLEAFGYTDAYAQFEALFARYGFWSVLVVGVAPIPFQVATVAAGAAACSIPLFLLATGLARAVRYYGLAWLVAAFGPRAKQIWQRNRLAAALVGTGVVVGLFLIAEALGDLLPAAIAPSGGP